jgi:hypothetical protein
VRKRLEGKEIEEGKEVEEGEAKRCCCGRALVVRRVKRGWGADFIRKASTEQVSCQEEFVTCKVLVRTAW